MSPHRSNRRVHRPLELLAGHLHAQHTIVEQRAHRTTHTSSLRTGLFELNFEQGQVRDQRSPTHSYASSRHVPSLARLLHHHLRAVANRLVRANFRRTRREGLRSNVCQNIERNRIKFFIINDLNTIRDTRLNLI